MFSPPLAGTGNVDGRGALPAWSGASANAIEWAAAC